MRYTYGRHRYTGYHTVLQRNQSIFLEKPAAYLENRTYTVQGDDECLISLISEGEWKIWFTFRKWVRGHFETSLYCMCSIFWFRGWRGSLDSRLPWMCHKRARYYPNGLSSTNRYPPRAENVVSGPRGARPLVTNPGESWIKTTDTAGRHRYTGHHTVLKRHQSILCRCLPVCQYTMCLLLLVLA